MVNKRILIVEDSELTRGIVKETLTSAGYDVIEASDGMEGLKLAFEETPDIIILDVMMPKIDGYKTCRMLAAGTATREIPVIMLTSKSSSADVKEGLEAGAVDYIRKPFDHIELLARVESALKIKTFRDQISELKAKLREMTTTDELTKLKNANYFWDYLNLEINKFNRLLNPLSIILLDIDDFKTINEKHGPIEGNMVIKEMAEFLKANVRRYDLIARYGGTQFVIVLVNTDEKESLVIAQKLINKTKERTFNIKDDTVNISITCGVATLTEKMSEEMFNSISLFERVDKALSHAKQAGKGVALSMNTQ